MLRAFKASGCAECGRRYPEVEWGELHVDHLEPAEKSFNVGVDQHRCTQADMLAELLKCQVLCAPCHRRRHRNGYDWGGQLALFGGSGGRTYDNREAS